MKYMLLFCRDQSKYESLTEDEKKSLWSRYHAYGVEAFESGKVSAGQLLEASAMATTVRVRAGKRQLTDGPFVETVEEVLGFMEIECDDLDEAIDWAARHPDAEMGAVEVRPIVHWNRDQAPGDPAASDQVIRGQAARGQVDPSQAAGDQAIGDQADRDRTPD